MELESLFSDIYFWAALVLFLLSVTGIFWILKSLQKDSETEIAEGGSELVSPAGGPDFNAKTVQIIAPKAPPAETRTLESLSRQISQIEETLSKIEKKFHEQNTDQMNEMAGQMKLVVQMLKSLSSASGG